MLEQDINALIAREAIRDLPLRYCDCVWRDDVDGVLDLFTPDGSFTASFDGHETIATGRDELRTFFEAGLSIKPRPYIHNHIVDLASDDAASGRCYLDLRSALSNMEWIGAGFYEDRYIKLENTWKFESRHFHALRLDEIPPGLEV